MAKLWRAAWNYTHVASSVRGVNVVHAIVRDAGGALSTSSSDEVRDALNTKYSALFRQVISNAWRQESLIVTEVLSPGSLDIPEQASLTIGTLGGISLSGDQLPVASTTLITLRTNAAIRSGHGRIFIPNPGLASYLDSAGKYDALSAYWVTNLPQLLTALDDDFAVENGIYADGTGHLVVYSRTRHAKPGPPDYYFDVASAQGHLELHWLRSRMTAP